MEDIFSPQTEDILLPGNGIRITEPEKQAKGFYGGGGGSDIADIGFRDQGQDS
ncbi:MAG: hypothetical protein J0652_02300 [Desulfobulbaceae bacterium]|jgi:hypothetical protein|nr:hypothetical protein [Desulfobulbaceae bacterium]